MSSALKTGSGSDGFQIFRLNELCRDLVSKSNYFQAANQLKRLLELQPTEINTMVMLVESYMNLDKIKQAFEIAEKLREAMMQSPRPEVRDFIQVAKEYGGSKFVTSLLLFWCACSIYKAERAPKEALYGIGECLFRMNDLGFGKNQTNDQEQEEIKKYRRCFASLRLRLMEDVEIMLKEFGDVDSDLQTVVSLRCLGNKADCSYEHDRYNEAIELFQSGIEQLKQQFGSNASKCVMLGEFLANIGISYLVMDSPDQQAAIAYLTQAQDAVNESEPVSEGEKTQKNDLTQILAKLIVAKKEGLGKKIFALFRK